MKNLTWSDNLCTVGKTCIHGFFNYEDMLWLLQMCPSGTFTPTFYELPEQWSYSWKTQNGILYNMETIKEEQKGFYFNFNEKENQTLLVALRLKGMRDRIN